MRIKLIREQYLKIYEGYKSISTQHILTEVPVESF
jgi:hypothetical protein